MLAICFSRVDIDEFKVLTLLALLMELMADAAPAAAPATPSIAPAAALLRSTYALVNWARALASVAVLARTPVVTLLEDSNKAFSAFNSFSCASNFAF